ncbi:hypothetical protein ABZ923_01660 [Streptomyces sp. NPDC046881]|uniref:hypothetical protein n=1 Tax=Streptomyces sp. NPDC046881 TaxID=3155374 RepID=UPI0034090773
MPSAAGQGEGPAAARSAGSFEAIVSVDAYQYVVAPEPDPHGRRDRRGRRLAAGRRDWLLWNEVCAEESPSAFMAGPARDSVELLNADRGRLPGFARVVGRRIQGLSWGRKCLAVRPRRACLRGRTAVLGAQPSLTPNF